MESVSNELEDRLQLISSNREKLQQYVEQLELGLDKLNNMLKEILSADVPETLKFSYKRINNIDMIVNSITRFGELVRKLRENIHNISVDEINVLTKIGDLVKGPVEIDVRELWKEISKLSKKDMQEEAIEATN